MRRAALNVLVLVGCTLVLAALDAWVFRQDGILAGHGLFWALGAVAIAAGAATWKINRDLLDEEDGWVAVLAVLGSMVLNVGVSCLVLAFVWFRHGK